MAGFELIPPDAPTPTSAGGYELIPPGDSSTATTKPDEGGVTGFLKQLGRQGLLTARYLAEGAAGLTDPINRALGLKPASEATGNLLTRAGMPEPEGALERVVGDVSRGLTQGAAFGAAGLGPMGALIAGGGGGGGGAGTARELGFGPVGQLAGGLAGGVAAPMTGNIAGSTLGALARGTGSYFAPFTRSGQESVVGRLLNQFAENPASALSNIERAPEFVPGSQATTATASADPGLLALQRTLMNEPESGPMFARQAAEANAARLGALADISGTPASLAAAKAARDAQAASGYGEALGSPLSLTAQNQKDLLALMQRPSMKTAINKANELAAEDSIDLSKLGMNDPQWLHYVKLGLDDLVGTSAQQGIGAVQRRAIINTKNQFLDWLDSVNPAYQTARANYAEASGPINRMETMQDIASRAQLAAPDMLGNPVLSQAKWKQLTATPTALGDLARVLTPEQMGTVGNIGADLNRAALPASVGRAIGSNTMQNLAMTNVLSSALGRASSASPLAKFISYPLGIPYKWSGAEQQIQDLLDQAALNPTLGARLMRAAPSPAQRAQLADELRQRGAGWLLGAAQATGQEVAAGR